MPVGRHPLQLYSLATPNGVKVTVMLEELLEPGYADAEYDVWRIHIGEPASQLHERYDASDFATKTQDKLTTG